MTSSYKFNPTHYFNPFTPCSWFYTSQKRKKKKAPAAAQLVNVIKVVGLLMCVVQGMKRSGRDRTSRFSQLAADPEKSIPRITFWE